MARITVEDCLVNVKNRFELVLIAAKRARMLASNPSLATVEWDRDKASVVALREIALNHINASILNEAENTTEKVEISSIHSDE